MVPPCLSEEEGQPVRSDRLRECEGCGGWLSSQIVEGSREEKFVHAASGTIAGVKAPTMTSKRLDGRGHYKRLAAQPQRPVSNRPTEARDHNQPDRRLPKSIGDRRMICPVLPVISRNRRFS